MEHPDKQIKFATPNRFDVPFGYHSVLGVYLAINAVPDTWLLVDSADCGTLRAELVHDNHDWGSTLITEDGRYRIANTGVCPHTVALDRNEKLASQIAAIGEGEGAFLFIYPPPVTAIVGLDYSVIAAKVADRLRMKVLPINPVDTAGGDWLSGYAHVMSAIAANIRLPEARPRRDAAAIVGYLWDRNEGDHAGTVKELTRLVEGVGLKVCTTWFSGVPTTDLAKVAEASWIIELPHAGEAARILSQRTGARVVELPLPAGLDGTFQWVAALGQATGRSKQAQAFIDQEAPAAYQRISKAVVQHFVDRDFAICLEPHLAVALARMVKELGGNVRLMALCGRMQSGVPEGLAEEVLAGTHVGMVADRVSGVADGCRRIPVLFANVQVIASVGEVPVAAIPLGFQAGGTHYLHDTPFLGIQGTFSLIDRIVAVSNHALVLRTHARRSGTHWDSPPHSR